MRILLTGADLCQSKQVTDLIETAGHRCLLSLTGAEALARLQKEPVDLVLLEHELPDEAGSALIPRLHEAQSGVRIIAVVGTHSTELEKEIRRQGVIFYMVKPVNLDQLETILKHMKTDAK